MSVYAQLSLMGKGSFDIERIDLFLFQAVDFFDMGSHDLLEALIEESMQTVIADSDEATPYLMITTHSRIEPLDAIGNPPFYWAVITRVKMQKINFS